MASWTGRERSCASLRAALVRGGRRRNIDRQVDRILAGIRAEQFRHPELVEQAMGQAALAHLRALDTAVANIAELEHALGEAFAQHPDAAILTSVEFDHADIYQDLDAVETAFKRLVNLVPRRGRIVAFDGASSSLSPDREAAAASIDRCISKAFCSVEHYGSKETSVWRIANLQLKPERTAWSVLREGRLWADFEFALAGEYNVWNATAAAALAAGCGISNDEISAALKTFKSVKRRLEVKAQVNGITIIDDFAHHPTAIAGTLKALRSRYPASRLWVILEPRSNTLRRRILQQDLARSLALADEIVVAKVFRSDAVPESERLELPALAADVGRRGRQIRLLADADAIVQMVAPEMRSGDVVAILSNGGFGGIYEKLPARLRSLAGEDSANAAAKA